MWQDLIDSISRCWGIATTQRHGYDGARGRPSRAGTPMNAKDGKDNKRRSDRVAMGLELHDTEWDALFQEDPNTGKRTKPVYSENKAKAMDNEYARALAHVKQVANPSRRKPHTSTKKKKTPAERKAEIFRTKANSESRAAKPANNNQPGNSFSRFLSRHEVMANALCFATPIRDKDEDDEPVRSSDTSAGGTLNTCEDTITSTIYWEQQYNHIIVNRPAVPLFNEFRVRDDELRQIVASDSHNSCRMIQLLDPPQRNREDVLQHHISQNNIALSSSEESEEKAEEEEQQSMMDRYDDNEVPGAVRLTAGSSRSSRSHNSTSPSTPTSSRSGDIEKLNSRRAH